MKQEFIALIEKHKGLISKVCNMYTVNAEDRKDLFQDIVVQLWRSYPAFSNASKVSTWMYKIALNVSITHVRKQSRMRRYENLDDEALNLADEQPDVEKAQILHAAIELLTGVEKAIIVLYMDDCSYKEIAEVIGISESNVGFKLNRIKNKLKEMVKNV